MQDSICWIKGIISGLEPAPKAAYPVHYIPRVLTPRTPMKKIGPNQDKYLRNIDSFVELADKTEKARQQ